MKSYTKVEISEAALEDLIRQNPTLVEDGLVYVDHQNIAAGKRLNMLIIGSDKSLVVAELKVKEEDGMLIQGLEYCDYESTNLEALAEEHPAATHALILAHPSSP